MQRPNGLTLFHLFGFEVKVDWSWVIVAVLIAWSLASQVFPAYYRGLSPAVYWQMGVFGAAGLFLSILAHEFAHSLVARRFGMPIKGITLFIFGGIAEMEEEPPSARSEFFMALAGPLTSAGLGLFFYIVYRLMGVGPVAVIGVVAYLASINFMLAVFNLLPAFPLDGGRLLRAALWFFTGRVQWATRIASAAGTGFSYLFMALGVLFILSGSFISGIWWFLISMFLSNASQMSYQKLLVRRALEGEPVRRFMKTDPVVAPAYISVRRLVEDYIYRYHYKMYPVVDETSLIGCVTTRQVKELPRDEWDRQSLQAVAIPCSDKNTISPEADAMQALEMMYQTGNSRLMVVENGKLVGIIALKDLLEFLSLKLDLEGESLEKKF